MNGVIAGKRKTKIKINKTSKSKNDKNKQRQVNIKEIKYNKSKGILFIFQSMSVYHLRYLITVILGMFLFRILQWRL